MAINLVQQTLINFELYLNGEHEGFAASSIDLPEVAFLTNEVKGAGILGTVEVPVLGHTENLQSTIHSHVLPTAAVKIFNQKQTVRIAAYGAAQVYDSATGEVSAEPIRVEMRCWPQSLNLGKFEPGEQMETEVVVTLDTLKITCRDETLLELDKFNYSYGISGANVIDDLQAALGR